MQFGTVVGLFLVTLGVILLALQGARFLSTQKVSPTQSSTKISEASNTNPLPGIIGVVCIVGGIGFYSVARRRDEPDPTHAIK